MIRVFGNTVMRKVFRPKCNNEISGRKKNWINKRFKNCTPHRILFS